MSKKSLLYIGAGVLLMLMAVLTFVEGALVFSSTMDWRFEKAELSFRVFKDSGYLRYYMQEVMDFKAWIEIVLLALAGLLLVAKAFVPDFIPDIALVGAFGLLAVLAFFPFIKSFINIFSTDKMEKFNNTLGMLAWALMDGLTLAAFGCMAAIILLKSNFGRFFFVPAGVAVLNAGLTFLANITGMFNMNPLFLAINELPYVTQWAFGASFAFFLFDCVLVAALFAAGMANNEE